MSGRIMLMKHMLYFGKPNPFRRRCSLLIFLEQAPAAFVKAFCPMLPIFNVVVVA